MYKLGMIGVGHMGGAILKGAVDYGALSKREIMVYDVSSERCEQLKKEGFTIAKTTEELRLECEFLLLAVAPQVFEPLLRELALYKPKHRQIIVSVAAGITSGFIKSHLGEVGVVCVMPNAPALIGMGATAMAKTDDVSQAEFDAIVEVFKAIGLVELLQEEQLFAVVPANGSAPAYVYYLINCIAESVAARGVPYDTALKLTAQTFKGSAELLMRSEKTPTELVNGVCTPGGLTQQSILSFEKDSLFDIIKRGCDACIDRGIEISKSK